MGDLLHQMFGGLGHLGCLPIHTADVYLKHGLQEVFFDLAWKLKPSCIRAPDGIWQWVKVQ